MKPIRSVTLLAMAWLVSGCLMTDGLKKVNQGLASVNNSLSGASGSAKADADSVHAETIPYENGEGGRSVSFAIPEGLCEPHRYVHAWKQEYITTWNNRVRTTSIPYDLRKTPEAVAAREALARMYLELPDPIPLRTMEETRAYSRKYGEGAKGGTCKSDEDTRAVADAGTTAYNDSVITLNEFKKAHESASK